MRVFARDQTMFDGVVLRLVQLGVDRKYIEIIEEGGERYWIEAYLTPKQKFEAKMVSLVGFMICYNYDCFTADDCFIDCRHRC
jgi:hypothetical protein